MGIAAAAAYVQSLAADITGIRDAPDYPPEQLNVFPVSVCYPASGEFRSGPAGLMKAIHNLVVEIHIARKDLQRDVENVLPYGESLAAAILADPTLGSTVDTVQADVGLTYTFGAMAWGRQATVGWRITIPIKIPSVL